MTWQHATHRMKFGAEIELLKGTGTYVLDAPADITLFSPQEVNQLAPPLTALIPKTFNSLTDVLSLPLKSFVFGIGDINQPPTFHAIRPTTTASSTSTGRTPGSCGHISPSTTGLPGRSRVTRSTTTSPSRSTSHPSSAAPGWGTNSMLTFDLPQPPGSRGACPTTGP